MLSILIIEEEVNFGVPKDCVGGYFSADVIKDQVMVSFGTKAAFGPIGVAVSLDQAVVFLVVVWLVAERGISCHGFILL